MKYQYCVVAVLASVLLGACESTSTRDGGSRFKSQETEAQKASSLNKQLGTAYLKQGNLTLAKEKLERAEKYNPKDPELHSVLALLYERLEMPAEVDSHYRTAQRLAPKDPQISNNYAVYLCRAGRTDEGVKRFLEAAKNPLYRTPAVAYTNAGVCLRAAKRYDDASTTFSRALEIRPNSAEAAYQAADLDMERGKPAEARDLVDKFTTAFDATADLLLIGARANLALGDRLGEEKYTRRLRVEYPGSDQLRALADLKRNPG